MQQMKNDSSTDYQFFVNEILLKVKQLMGEEYNLRIYKVTKNNSLELDSLVMLKQGNHYAPNIYLAPYYDAYLEGTSIKELSERLCDIYRQYQVPMLNENFQYSFEGMISNIIYRIVNYESNKKLLEKVPFIKYLDLAITFHCLVRDDEEGIGTIRITNEHLREWKTSLQELHKYATVNTKSLFPPIIRSMEDVIHRMLTENDMSNEKYNLTEELFDSYSDEGGTTNLNRMFVLTNQKGINGASCLLYDKVLHDFANKVNSDFYILPSSIHELILVPYNESMDEASLTKMVKEVNQTQVAPEEVLSNRVYYYSRENNAIIM
jgi:hypothetical protein